MSQFLRRLPRDFAEFGLHRPGTSDRVARDHFVIWGGSGRTDRS
jgi:hypothetical protein